MKILHWIEFDRRHRNSHFYPHAQNYLTTRVVRAVRGNRWSQLKRHVDANLFILTSLKKITNHQHHFEPAFSKSFVRVWHVLDKM